MIPHFKGGSIEKRNWCWISFRLHPK